MIYHGRVQNGVIVLEGGARLPEGTEVHVDVVAAHSESQNGEANQTIWDKLLEIAGTAEGLPPDAARQHDHYLYGTPKRDE